MKNNLNKYHELREQYPVFSFHSYQIEKTEGQTTAETDWKIAFDFRVEHRSDRNADIVFRPTMHLKAGRHLRAGATTQEVNAFAFQIGMIELISYWKACCSPVIKIEPYALPEHQQDWWRKLYYKGLGEFFYQNGLQPRRADFFQFRFPENASLLPGSAYARTPESARVLVPIGGGKDSVVTLELLRHEKEIVPFIINPRGATSECARIAGFPNHEDIVILQRQIAPELLELNAKGFLNGHTPFSAMLAFYTLLVSHLTGIRDIALSNESSANEPTIPGSDINHQYSKSLEFEEDFRTYVRENMNDCAHYFSFLRPHNELWIAEQFAKFEQYHSVFRSCNAGSKEDKWCCNCSKCLFAYIILSPFLSDEKMQKIFGDDLLDRPDLQQYFDELTGIAANKPFECVGTLSEVNEAIQRILETRGDKYLLQHYRAAKNM